MPIFKSDNRENNEAEKGVIILGCPRSGTTLLRRLLDSHPDLSCPGETFLFRGAARFLKEDTISGGGGHLIFKSLTASIRSKTGDADLNVMKKILKEKKYSFRHEVPDWKTGLMRL